MLFNSIEFLLFFPVVVLVYFIIPTKFKNIWLLISSYFYYISWNAKYAILIFYSTIISYFCGIILKKIGGGANKRKTIYMKAVVFAGVSLNLIVLFFFKYLNMFLQIVSDIGSAVHIALDVPSLDIVLPVGISFYTFQALGYMIDVYRGEISAEKNFIKYALFVSFFPQLVAGPIERSKNLLKQLSLEGRFSFDNFREGIYLMIWGYFLKIVLADRIAIYVDGVYGNIYEYGGWFLIVATVLFAIQIYCDFYGYSVIAMGAAKILGISLIENFNAPYLSTSVADFWRKWHISLTSWFKDYMYIPLGGSRKGKLKKYFNKMIVFLVSGLWHGADLSYVVWGGWNGLCQIIGEQLQLIRGKFCNAFHFHRDTIGIKIVQGFITFVLVDFSWIFFRAESISKSFEVIRQIFMVRNPWILFDGSLYDIGLDEKNFQLMWFCIGILIFADIAKHYNIILRKVLIKQDHLIRYIVIAFSIYFILMFGIYGPAYNKANFIYFQF